MSPERDRPHTAARRRLRPPGGLALAAVAAVLVTMLVSSSVLAVDPFVATFEIDGNATAQTTDDWGTLFEHPEGEFTGEGNSVARVFINESSATGGALGPNQDTVFTSGSAQNLDVNEWSCTLGNAEDKNDLLHVFAAVYTDLATNDLLLYFGADRQANNGSASLGFWLLKDSASCAATQGGGGTSFVGSHTEGDLLVMAAFTSGGRVAEFQVYQWVGPGQGDSPSSGGPLQKIIDTGPNVDEVVACNEGTPGFDDHVVCVAVNPGPEPAPWNYTPKFPGGLGPNTYPASSFFEGGVNLSAIFGEDVCFTQVLATTQGSHSLSSSMTDYAMGDLNTCGSIELKKEWVGAGGQVTLQIGITEGGDDVASQTTGLAGAGPLTTGAQTVVPGTYFLSETAGANTDLDDYDTTLACVDATDENAPVTVGAGDSVSVGIAQSVVCTFTNSRLPQLKVVKATVPTDDDGKFNLLIDGTPQATDVGNGGDTGFHTVATGTHTVSETAGTDTSLSDYDTSISCDNGDGNTGQTSLLTSSLDYGDVVTCTITNSRLPQLKVVKATVPTDDDGKFNLLIDGTPEATNVGNGGDTGFHTVATGTHTVSETAGTDTDLADYDTSISCDNGDGNTGQTSLVTSSLDYGDVVTCTITNSRLPQLKVVKATVPTDDDGKFNLLIDGTPQATDVGNGGDTGFHTVATGTHTVSETAGDGTSLDDFDTSISCDNGDGPTAGTSLVTSALGYGDVVTCTITNSRLPQLNLVKATVPTDDDGLFDLRDDGVVKKADAGHDDESGFFNTTTGSHTVSELAGTGTVLAEYDSAVSCDSGKGGSAGTSHTFTLNYGDVVTCTFTNSRLAQLIVVKSSPDDTEQEFDFSRTGIANFMLKHGEQNDSGTTLSPGTYVVCELDLAVAWSTTAELTLNGVAGPAALYNPDAPTDDLGTRCHDIELDYGDVATIVFTNTPPPGGDARTIGYWRNWSSCTGGNQYDKALARGEWDRTLDGNLSGLEIGDIVFGNINEGEEHPDCEDAVNILSKRNLDGEVQGGDAAYNLAAQLLAAKLNIAAGAASCQEADDAIVAAQELLKDDGFDGDKAHWRGGRNAAAERQLANELAAILDAYNNNTLCP